MKEIVMSEKELDEMIDGTVREWAVLMNTILAFYEATFSKEIDFSTVEDED